MTQRTVVVLVAAAVTFAAAVAGQADDALRWRIKQLQAEVSRLQAQEAGQAQLAADLDSERSQKEAAQRMLASVQDQLRGAQASLVQGQEREAALQQALGEAQGRLARVEAQLADEEATRHALGTAQGDLEAARSALAEEQEGHRSTRGILSGVRQALEQASAAVVKLRFTQNSQNRSRAAAQAELQAAVTEAQQRQWQAEADLAQLRRTRASGQAQLAADLDSERGQKEATQRTLASVHDQLRSAQASLVQGQEREAALRQALGEAQGRLARVEAQLADEEATRHALGTAQGDLETARSALAEEQEWHRSTRGILSGVRQALEQASAAVVKLRFAQNSQNRSHAAAQAALQQELLETQQRHWQAEEAIVSLRRELSQAQGDLAQVRQALLEEEAKGETVRLSLASTRQELARSARALAQEQGSYAAQGQVLAGTQAALSETSALLAEARAAMAEQAEAHTSAQAALQSDKQQWVERFWDMEQQRARTRVALRKEETAHQETRQALEQRMQRAIASLRRELSQAHGDGARVRQALLEEEAKGEAARLSLASAREELARSRRALAQEQGSYAAQGQVLANTQAALAETSASLAQTRVAMEEQAASHTSEREASQSAKQEWVERYWDMEQQRASTRSALRREEMAHRETRQALDQSMRKARLDGIRMSHLSRDAREARETLKRELQPSAEARALADLVRQRFADEIQQGQMSVRVGRRGVKLSSADLFDFARAVEPGAQSVRTLNRVAEILQEVPSHRLRFAVHTDNIPLRQGSKWPTNWELATARAAKLARYLITDKGVAGERLSIAGYGEYRPIADNSTPEGRRQNRRVEVVIKAPRNK